MPRRAFLTLVLGVSGNVNADAGIGTRIPLKKVVSWNKEVRAFVSPRCIRRGVRKRLAEKGFQIDPQLEKGGQLGDVGDPVKYVDDDLFGYLSTQKGKGELQSSRSGPVKVSPLIALHHTEISVEFAGRFPRKDISLEAKDANPVPFEIETAQWLGSMHVIISEDVGKFQGNELTKDVLGKIEKKYKSVSQVSEEVFTLSKEERMSRIKSLMEVLIREGWSFPRGSEAVSQPEYHYALLLLSDSFIPSGNVLKMSDDLTLNVDNVIKATSLYSWDKGYIVDYREGKIIKLSKKESGKIEEKTVNMTSEALDGVVEAVASYLL